MNTRYTLPLSLMALTTALWADMPPPLLFEDFSDSNSVVAEKLLNHPAIELSKDGGTDGSNAIRVAYVGGEMGSERVVVGLPLNRKTETATLSFDVFFEDDWQFVKGGKMHGVGPKSPVTGGRPRRPDGWSSRIMFLSNGRAHNYLYDQNQEVTYGVGDTTKEPIFTTGKWQHVELQTKLNDVGQANGFARMLVDGKEVLFNDSVEFRGEGGDDTLISQCLFSTFHGGNDPSWAPKDEAGNYVTVHARYDNFIVTEQSLSEPLPAE